MKFRAAVVTAAAVPLALGLAACGGADQPTGYRPTVPVTTTAAPQKAVSTPPPAVVRLNRATFVPAMNTALTKQKSWRTVGTMKAEGQTLMTITSLQTADPVGLSMQMSGAAFGGKTATIIVTKGAMYASIPGLTPAGKYKKAPAGAKDLAELLDNGDPTKIFGSFDKSLVNLKFVREETIGGQKLDRYTVTVDTLKALKLQGKKLPANVPANKIPKTLTYTVWLDKANLSRRLSFDFAGVSMLMTMSDYNKPVTITAPPANKIVR